MLRKHPSLKTDRSNTPMLTLGFDTSNYATSLAVFDTAAREVVCAKKRFLPVKARLRLSVTTDITCLL